MTILEEVLAQIKTPDTVEKLRMVCHTIEKEEAEKLKSEPEKLEYFTNNKPKGVNIFLTVLCKDGKTFVCLEREFKNNFIIKVFKGSLIQKSIPVEDGLAPEKIIYRFAEVLTHENGE